MRRCVRLASGRAALARLSSVKLEKPSSAKLPVEEKKEEEKEKKERWRDSTSFWSSLSVLAVSVGSLAFSYNDRRDRPNARARRAVSSVFEPLIAPIAPAFVECRPKGFDALERFFSSFEERPELREKCFVVVVDGESGIGKSFAVRSRFKGQTGVIYAGFKCQVEVAPWSTLRTSFGLPEKNCSETIAAIELALTDFKAKNGHPATVILDDISSVLGDEASRGEGKNIVSTLLDLTDRGLVRCVLMGNPSVEQEIEAAQIPGSSRIDQFYTLEPVPFEKMRAALLETLKSSWGRDPTDREMHVLGLLVGHRFAEVSTVARTESFERALEAAGGLVDRAFARLEKAIIDSRHTETFRSPGLLWGEWVTERNFTQEALASLAQSATGELRGSQIRAEWRSALEALQRDGILRYDWARDAAGELERRADIAPHRPALEAAFRVVAHDTSLLGVRGLGESEEVAETRKAGAMAMKKLREARPGRIHS